MTPQLVAIEAKMSEYDAQIAKLQKDFTEQINSLRKEVDELKQENQMVSQLWPAQLLAELPPITEQNVREWCKSAEPSKEEQRNAQRVIDEVKRQLFHFASSFGYYTRPKVVCGGSVAKDTNIKGQFDVDMVVFLDKFDPLKMGEYKTKARQHMGNAKWLRDTPAGSTFQLQNVNVDVLFTGKPPDGSIIQYSDPKTRFYMASVTEQQVHYVKSKAGPVERDVIRGIKKWIKASQWEGIRRPSSYLLEVLVIETSLELVRPLPKSAGKPLPDTLKIRRLLFTHVLQQLAKLHEAEVKDHDQKLPPGISKPFVLDPVNNHNNLLDPRAAPVIAWAVRKRLQMLDIDINV